MGAYLIVDILRDSDQVRRTYKADENQVRKCASCASKGSQVLKRSLSIFSDLIFDSNVERGIPSLEAAPKGPYTRPPHSVNAASIIAFS
jgi:hypothetical protein